jgi:UV DNA damage repair endonuclease
MISLMPGPASFQNVLCLIRIIEWLSNNDVSFMQISVSEVLMAALEPLRTAQAVLEFRARAHQRCGILHLSLSAMWELYALIQMHLHN